MILALSAGCLGPAPATDPASMFDAVHQDFEDHYALFPVKDVSWTEEHAAFGNLGAGATDQALHDALTGLLGVLDDNHVHLLVPHDPDTSGPTFPDWTSGVLEDLVQEDFVIEQTLDLLESSALPHPKFAWGRIGEIGYVWIGSASDRAVTRHLDDAMGFLGDVDGLVVDVRGNGGGLDAIYQAQAAYFVTDEPTYARTRLRASATPGDFTDWADLRVAKAQQTAFDGPMVVLQHRFTVSAAEGFLLAMAQRPDTTFVGEVSSGAFGTVWWRDLPNGWLYSLTVSDVRDLQGTSWEGSGWPVDIEAKSTPEALRSGEDRALEAALDVLGGDGARR